MPRKSLPILLTLLLCAGPVAAHVMPAGPGAHAAEHPAPRLTVTAATASAAVTGGWFRALPPAVPSGGYFILRNTGGKTLTLTGLTSPACGMLMMHKSENGSMTHVMSLNIAAGTSLSFAPGGYHLMCMDATPLLKPGTQVPVTLQFADGSSVTAAFDVRNASGK